jgi:hypothetical protein
VLRGIFGPKREIVTGCWGRLHNGELHNLYASPYIIGVIISGSMRGVGHAERMGEKRYARSILVGESEGKSSIGRLRCRWDDNVRMVVG